GGVRVREQPVCLELRQLVAHGRRRDAEAGALDEVPRTDRLAGGGVLLDHAREQVALPRSQISCPLRCHLQAFYAQAADRSERCLARGVAEAVARAKARATLCGAAKSAPRRAGQQ